MSAERSKIGKHYHLYSSILHHLQQQLWHHYHQDFITTSIIIILFIIIIIIIIIIISVIPVTTGTDLIRFDTYTLPIATNINIINIGRTTQSLIAGSNNKCFSWWILFIFNYVAILFWEMDDSSYDQLKICQSLRTYGLFGIKLTQL